MSSPKRQQLLLALLALAAAVGLWRWLPTLVPDAPPPAPVEVRRAPRQRPARNVRAGETALDLKEVVELRLRDLEVEPSEFRVGRDPFRFGFGPHFFGFGLRFCCLGICGCNFSIFSRLDFFKNY